MLIAERVYFSILVNQWTHPPGQRITSVDDVNTQNYEIALVTLVGVTVLAFVALIAVLCLLRRRPGKTMGKITIPKKENTESYSLFFKHKKNPDELLFCLVDFFKNFSL